MKEYIITVLYVAIFSMLIELILPKTKLKKYILTLVSLLLIINIISPVVSVLKTKDVEKVLIYTTKSISNNLKDIDIASNSYDFSKYSLTNNVKEKIENNIKEKFGQERIKDVNIILDEAYKVEDIEIKMVEGLEKMSKIEISNFIQNISDEYNIIQSKIKVIEVNE